ncbi:MAG: efflux RND transporter permease subunit [Hoeflea sp.]|uniref:efflux RND transporter permease subunit n=1 Tax=Hoeflea sp. TaxID=1940281 RepID=UPI00272FDD69|nr:efflux RND transporter permease subunit [Hoeflea sp.]MDP2120984.1 efflux RND transporter permease subunit [Hoeflea sp.]
MSNGGFPGAGPAGFSRGGLVSTFIRHPNAANLLMVLMILFGAFSIARINTQFFPTIDRPTISIGVAWSGASAEDVETNILALIEPGVRYVSGVDRMSSTAAEGSATVRLEFDDSTDMTQAMTDVETAVKTVTNLPEDADDPTISRSVFFDSVAKLAVYGSSDEAVKRAWAKRIRDDLIDRGIDRINFTGLRDAEIRIEVPEIELRRLGMTIADVSTAIAANSRDLPSGTVAGAVERQLRTLADAQGARQLGDVEVRSFASGEKVLLGDIARIEDGFDADDTRGLASGSPAIELDVRRAPTADTLQTASILSAYIDEIRPQLPPGIEIATYEVASDALAARIWLLVKNGLGGLVVVVLILFLFLNARIAFWVAAGIPVAMFATIGIMYVSGQTINMMSLFALIMMLGIIVDVAIVVGEHTATRLEMGDDPQTAAENGVNMMFTPVIAAMTTTLAAFAPILLIGDTTGQMMAVLPMVVIAVLIASLLECFLVLPGHLAISLGQQKPPGWSWWRQFLIALVLLVFLSGLAGRLAVDLALGEGGLRALAGDFAGLPSWVRMAIVVAVSLVLATLVEWALLALRRRNSLAAGSPIGPGDSRFRRGFDAGFELFRDGPFQRLVQLAWDWRYVTLSIAIAMVMVLAIGLARSGRVEFVFFPSPEAENITGTLIFNAGLPEETALKAIAAHEQALRDADKALSGDGPSSIRAVFTTFGASSRSGSATARIGVQLTTSEERDVRTPDMVNAWRQAAPDIAGVSRFTIAQFRGGPPGRDIEVRIQGERVAALKSAAADVVALLSGINGVSGLDDNLPWGKPELVMELTPHGAALGFSIAEVGRQIRNAFDGAMPFRFPRGNDEVTVRLVQEPASPGSQALRDFELRSPGGTFVPLSEVVLMTERQGFSAIQRRDGKSTISVTGDIDTAVTTTGGVVEQLNAGGGLDLIAARHGVGYSFGGRSEEQENAFTDLRLGVAVALSVIYIILSWVFASYWRPIAVLLIIPFGVVGAIFGHWLLGYQLTILSFIGLLGLAGILVNDSIILVARLEERRAAGDTLAEAAVGASRDRFRAVLLTSLTTIGGLLPLLYETSLQAQFLLPMAITIVFGLAMTTLLVLFLVPALVGIGDDFTRALSSLYGRRPALRQS